MPRSWEWFIKFPLDVYAIDIEFDKREYNKPPNEKDVRAYARQWEGTQKLPNGFECWVKRC